MPGLIRSAVRKRLPTPAAGIQQQVSFSLVSYFLFLEFQRHQGRTKYAWDRRPFLDFDTLRFLLPS